LTGCEPARTARVGRYSNAALNLHWDDPPRGKTELIMLATPDRSATSGVLYRPAGATRKVVAISHPRVDMTSHYLIPHLVAAGFAVFAQRLRTVNNDVTAVHEELLLDLAVAHVHLRELGFEELFLLGNSGGASLYCLYLQQAGRDPFQRLADTPAGREIDLSGEMPVAAGLILLAAHPGQGDLLLHCIDPAVADESDGASLNRELSLFEPANGFRAPPESSSFPKEFLDRYRAGQAGRVRSIDAKARSILRHRAVLRADARRQQSVALRRAALTPSFITVYRTDADPRTIDLSLDPSERDYGSIFSRRPDLTNHGTVGFGRLTTPDAWLSTWSSFSSRAAIRLSGPEVTVPTLTISYSADNSVFPCDTKAIVASLGATDKELVTVRGDHYGYAPGSEERSAGREAAAVIIDWLQR
jgi:pimeloyl-ACP methyl ester carboxylesterase